MRAKKQEQRQPEEEQINLLKPEELKAFLDDYVIGQEQAKKYCLLQCITTIRGLWGPDLGVELQKSNILMLGPTGSGKTFGTDAGACIKCTICDRRCNHTDRAGYVGEDVENILLKMIQAADYNIERAQHGIIYIDEIDKISKNQRMYQLPEMFPERACSRHFLRY